MKIMRRPFKIMSKRYTGILLILLSLPLCLGAQDLPVPKTPEAWVNDYADVFSASQESALNQKLGIFEQQSSNQIFLVTLSDNGGYQADMLAPMIGEYWGVGQAGKDNGVVVLMDMDQRDVFIATGYGNEEFITDVEAHLIVNYTILPNFKGGYFYEGIDTATNNLISLLGGEISKADFRRQYPSQAPVRGFGLGGFILMIIIFSLVFGGRRRSAGIGGRSNLPLWIALGMMSGSRSSGSWGNFSSGGGGFGGGGGGFGGFSGGGGGSFGGGGAGGSW